ncbi:uncharacterized protein LOC109856968 [Pseudomyrmex gracilis]|uniref:uncharacterized protein LOC109856968 n=1 Tax=Pseudomyrmex gracilis TaxID=219809 RepID=UPI0009950AB7|nr:uncharacterized protein LOC109856968 [Pseudomyrmex gracilis]
MEPFIKINMSAPDLEKFRGDNSEIIKIILLKLKAQLLIEVSRSSIYMLGGIGPNKTLTGLLAPISDGKIDIGMNVRSLLSLWKVRYTYPHTRSSLCIFTKPIPAVSSFIKLIKFLSPGTLAGIILMCLLTYVIFTKTEGYIKSVLQIIRLVVCVAVLRPPKINSSRIFLCMTLILILNVNALFQSHLSFLLTVPVYYHHNIDTLEGLKVRVIILLLKKNDKTFFFTKSGYTIYGPSNFKTLLSDPVLESRYMSVTYNECKEFVENSTTAACLGDCLHMYYRIKNKNLVKSKILREMIQSYVTREDWPLFNRVDHNIQMMMEAGLILKSRDDSLLEIKREMKIKEAQKSNFKVMLLSHLTFSFYFLGVGYACATVIFILELVV